MDSSTELTTMNIEGMEEAAPVKGMDYFTELTTMNIEGMEVAAPVKRMDYFRELTTMNIEGMEVAAPVKRMDYFRELTSMNIEGMEVAAPVKRMDYFRELITMNIEGMEVAAPVKRMDYLRKLSEDVNESNVVIDDLQLHNKYLEGQNKSIEYLLQSADATNVEELEEMTDLKSQIDSLNQCLTRMTSIAEQLEELRSNQNVQKEKIAQLKHEKKQMIPENKALPSNVMQLTDELDNLNQVNENQEDAIKQLKHLIKVMEEKALNHEQMTLKKEDSLEKMYEKHDELSTCISEVSIIIQDLRKNKRILQEKLDEREGENALLRQQNFGSGSSLSIPPNSLMYNTEEIEKEEIKAHLTSQMLNAEDSTLQPEDGTSCHGESRNFDVKKSWSRESSYSRILGTVAAAFMILAVLRFFSSSESSCSTESQVQLCRDSLWVFLEQVMWHYWDLYHREQPPL